MIVPLVIAVPLGMAAVVAIFGRRLPELVVDAIGVGTALAGAVLSGILLARTAHRTVVYWFGGWEPHGHEFPLGIAFAVDRFGAALALLAFVLTAAMLLYSWHYLEDRHYLFETLTLVFAAGMAGFALSGDLFNMFVFFELMSVAAYALTAYKIEEETALQAAFNFAISNSVGSFLVVFGLALVYGRTGSLNLAELSTRLDGRHDGLVVVAFTLLICGFMVKAAIVPFHFWLADAYAAAPAPVCVLFAGVMSDLGLYAIARVYWATFSAPLGPFESRIRVVLLVFGALTALVAGVMCVLQRHLKRLLAYSTISELGCVLMGVALLSRDGLAGAALTVIAHAFAKGALFLAGGIILLELHDADELRLFGKGRGRPTLTTIWLLGCVALASPPFLGTFTGHAEIDDAAAKLHEGWVTPMIAAATILSTGAMLRAGARVFLGVGTRADPLLSQEPPESPGPREHPSPTLMKAVALTLAVAGLVAGAATGLAASAKTAAGVFVDHGAYVSAVLSHHVVIHAPAERWVTHGSSIVWAVVTLAGSFAWALFGLYRAKLPSLAPLVRPLKAVHSGEIGDYIAWLTCGVAVIGGVFALTLR